MKKQTKGLITVIALVVIALSVALPLLLVKSDVAPPSTTEPPVIKDELYLSAGGQDLTGTEGHAKNFYIYPGETKRIDVVNTFAGDYTVKIVVNSNATETFDFYTISGQLKSFYMQKDLTSGFEIEKAEDYFTIAIPESGMAGILGKVFKGDVIIVGETPKNMDLFAAVIDFENGATLIIEFHIGILAGLVELSEEEVTF